MTPAEFPPLAMKEPDRAVTNPMDPGAEFRDVVHFDHQVPVIAHQAIAPKGHVGSPLSRGDQVEEPGVILGP